MSHVWPCPFISLSFSRRIRHWVKTPEIIKYFEVVVRALGKTPTGCEVGDQGLEATVAREGLNEEKALKSRRIVKECSRWAQQRVQRPWGRK